MQTLKILPISLIRGDIREIVRTFFFLSFEFEGGGGKGLLIQFHRETRCKFVKSLK